MRILLDDERKRKEVFDLFRMFLPEEELVFTGDDPDIVFRDHGFATRENFREYETKREAKRLLYRLLEERTGIAPPWGILTGVRPGKLAGNLAEEKGREEAFRVLTEDYLLDPDRARALLDIKALEKECIAPDRNAYSLYLNIPFCPSRCAYCSFPTVVTENRGGYREGYTKRLIGEMEAVAPALEGKKLRTIYIGGGTPTALKKDQLEKILKALGKTFEIPAEFTVEAGREDTLDSETLDLLKDYGVTRICLNPQSLRDDTLETAARPQDNEHLLRLVGEAKERGLIVNCDLIAGLPGENRETVEKTLCSLETEDPEQITVHTLSLKKGSKWEGKQTDYKKEIRRVGKILAAAREHMKETGRRPYYLYRQKRILGNYENTGYSKPGKYCLYNMIMTEELETVVGLGMTSNTKLIGETHIQIPNPKNIRDYMKEDFIDKKERIGRFYNGESRKSI